jgi:hypothetical protein
MHWIIILLILLIAASIIVHFTNKGGNSRKNSKKDKSCEDELIGINFPLMKGMPKSAPVGKWQNHLNLNDAKLIEDEKFGPLTEDATFKKYGVKQVSKELYIKNIC